MIIFIIISPSSLRHHMNTELYTPDIAANRKILLSALSQADKDCLFMEVSVLID